VHFWGWLVEYTCLLKYVTFIYHSHAFIDRSRKLQLLRILLYYWLWEKHVHWNL
jgi:hypothetical protein